MNKPTLFAVTKPVHPNTGKERSITAEESIVYMARVSSPNQRTEDADKLLTYLVKHSHWSPFDMVDMTVEIHTSRAIMAQILRHWSFRFQEFSQRYAAVEDGVDWSHVEARIKGTTNRQGSHALPGGHPYTEGFQEQCDILEKFYHNAIRNNIAPECARMILPLATPTRAYMKGSVRSWMTYFWQRCDPHAQAEHRELAEQLFEIFKTEFPVIGKLVETYKPAIIERA